MIQRRIERTKALMEGTPELKGATISTTYHENKDGSVDGQLTVSNLARGIRAFDILVAIDRTLPEDGLASSLWTSFGFRWPMANDDDDERYDHFKGLNQTFAYPTPGTKIHTRAADTSDMMEKIEKAGWRKPTHVIFRLHWNPKGMQPIKLKKSRRGRLADAKRNR